MNKNFVISAALTSGIAIGDYISKKAKKNKEHEDVIVVSAEPISMSDSNWIGEYVKRENNRKSVRVYSCSDLDSTDLFQDIIKSCHGTCTVVMFFNVGGQKSMTALRFSPLSLHRIKNIVKVNCEKRGMLLTDVIYSIFDQVSPA